MPLGILHGTYRVRRNSASVPDRRFGAGLRELAASNTVAAGCFNTVLTDRGARDEGECTELLDGRDSAAEEIGTGLERSEHSPMTAGVSKLAALHGLETVRISILVVTGQAADSGAASSRLSVPRTVQSIEFLPTSHFACFGEPCRLFLCAFVSCKYVLRRAEY